MHARAFNGPFFGTTQISWYQKGKTNLDFSEAGDSEWQWHHLAICKSVPCSKHITTPAPHHSVFLQTTISVKALKASNNVRYVVNIYLPV